MLFAVSSFRHNLFNPGQMFLMRAPFVGWPLAQLWTMSSWLEDCVVPCGHDYVGEEQEEVRIQSYKRLRKWKLNVNCVTSQEMVKVDESGKVLVRIAQHPQLYLFHEKNDSYQSLKELVVFPFNHFQISGCKIISEAKRRGMSVFLIDNSIYLGCSHILKSSAMTMWYVVSSPQNILRCQPTLLVFGESLSVLTPEVKQGWIRWRWR